MVKLHDLQERNKNSDIVNSRLWKPYHIIGVNTDLKLNKFKSLNSHFPGSVLNDYF